MKKRKAYEVSVINKTYSKTYSDQTKFYTSDTALELNFQLKEVEYDFDSAEIILLNDDDHSLVTRPVSKSAEGFTYELEDDIIAHFGEWKGQLKFKEDDEIYVSSPVGFRIEDDLNSDMPPQLTEVNTWKNLREIADGLIADIRSELDSVAGKVSEIEGAESKRQSAELIRVNNENQRNLTSVDEFVKLQNAIGGRNLLTGTHSEAKAYTKTSWYFNEQRFTPSKLANLGVGLGDKLIYRVYIDKPTEDVQAHIQFDKIPVAYVHYSGNNIKAGESGYSTLKLELKSSDLNQLNYIRVGVMGTNSRQTANLSEEKLELDTIPTDWSQAPEDYTIVSKDDYYNHIKLVNNAKDNEFNQLKQAVIALGGTV